MYRRLAVAGAVGAVATASFLLLRYLSNRRAVSAAVVAALPRPLPRRMHVLVCSLVAPRAPSYAAVAAGAAASSANAAADAVAELRALLAAGVDNDAHLVREITSSQLLREPWQAATQCLVLLCPPAPALGSSRRAGPEPTPRCVRRDSCPCSHCSGERAAHCLRHSRWVRRAGAELVGPIFSRGRYFCPHCCAAQQPLPLLGPCTTRRCPCLLCPWACGSTSARAPCSSVGPPSPVLCLAHVHVPA